MAVLCAIVGVASTSRGVSEDRRPNVIVIVTDDQGYGDFGATGNPVFETPNIDRLAAQSTSFSMSPRIRPTIRSMMCRPTCLIGIARRMYLVRLPD